MKATKCDLDLLKIGHVWYSNNWAAAWENQLSAKSKTKVQTSFAVTAKLISAFVFATRVVESLFYLYPVSSF